MAPPGYYLNSIYRPEDNPGSVRPLSYSQEHHAPTSAASDLRGTSADMPVSNLSANYTPNSELSSVFQPGMSPLIHISAFAHWSSTNNHRPIFTPSQSTPWSVVPQPGLPVNNHGTAFIPSLAAPWNEIPQAGTKTKRSPSPAFPFTLPAPSPPPFPARPTSVPPQQPEVFLPPPSPPTSLAHLIYSSSNTTLVETPSLSTLNLHGNSTKIQYTTERGKDDASSSTLVRCHCCLRNPVSFRELGVSWCGECFEMVQSRRQR